MISFDGFSGTGKTTQARIISETYRIPLIYWDNQFESWHPEVNSLEAAIRTYCNLTCFLKTDKEVFILDCCMFGVIRYLVFNASDEQRINFINIFDNIIQSTLSREPLCFYLFMPEQLATYQRDKREGNATILETPIKSNETDQKFKEIVDQDF